MRPVVVRAPTENTVCYRAATSTSVVTGDVNAQARGNVGDNKREFVFVAEGTDVYILFGLTAAAITTPDPTAVGSSVAKPIKLTAGQHIAFEIAPGFNPVFKHILAAGATPGYLTVYQA